MSKNKNSGFNLKFKHYITKNRKKTPLKLTALQFIHNSTNQTLDTNNIQCPM